MQTSTEMRAQMPEGGAPRLLGAVREAYRTLDFLAPAGDLLLRCWVSWAFFASGLTKIQSWETTVLLFQYEYQVPVLPPVAAAGLSVCGELVLPVLLALGVAGRFAAIGLFVLNIVAVASYPGLMEAGLEWHKAWGLVLLVFALRGPGTLSLDHWLMRRFSA